MKKPIGIFIIILLLISLLPSRLFADTQTYYIPIDESITAWYSSNKPRSFKVEDDTVRLTALSYWNDLATKNYFFVSQIQGKHAYRYNDGTLSTTYNLTKTQNVDGITYYYEYVTMTGVTFNEDFITNIITQDSGLSTVTGAIYYTFGEGAQEPQPTITYGDLKNLGFYTKFTNSQQSNISQMALNRDIISWDKFQDSSGNDLNDINLRVDIQAAVVDYEASIQGDLLGQTLADINIGTWQDLITISPNVGQYETSWRDVARALWGVNNINDTFWNSLFTGFDASQGYYYKNGWIYRVRLRTSDNSYVGNWNIIYNTTSAPPADSDKVYTNYYVYNYTVPDQGTYEILQTINQYNNTENNWYINDQPFDPEENENTDMSWLAKLIEAIITLANSILSFLGNLIHDLLGLFTFDSFNLPDWDLNVQNTIDNTGMFGEAVEFTSDLQETITDVEYVQPVLYYPGFELMGVDLIPELTINLNDYVTSEDLADLKATAYLVTDGFIYLSLLLLIKNKIMGVFKK